MTVNHAARVMRVITWNQPNDDGNRNSDLSAEGNEPYGVVLDKLLTWEKRLYDEVKVQSVIFFICIMHSIHICKPKQLASHSCSYISVCLFYFLFLCYLARLSCVISLTGNYGHSS